MGPSGSHADFTLLPDYEYVFLVGLQKILNKIIILGDRAKMNKLVQMAWTFSNDRFVNLCCCCCSGLSLSVITCNTCYYMASSVSGQDESNPGL